MQRFTGTLEPIVAAPSSFVTTAYGFAAATASLGAYAIAATWIWATAVFGLRLEVASPGWLAASLLSALVGLSVLGVVLAALYVLTRQAMTLSNLLEYPVWILAGVLVPAAALPEPLRVAGRVLALSWSVDAIERSARGESPVVPLLMSVLLAALTAVGAWWMMRRFEFAVRVRGTLSLR
jgi:ABC-2 type transport system permease protein